MCVTVCIAYAGHHVVFSFGGYENKIQIEIQIEMQTCAETNVQVSTLICERLDST